MNSTLDLTELATYLIHEGLMSGDTAKQAYKISKQQDIPFITYAVKNNLINSDDFLNHCKTHFGLKTFDLTLYDPSWVNNLALDINFFHRYHVIPLYKEQNILHIGISDPTDRSALDAIIFHTGIRVQAVLVDELQLSNLIGKYFSKNSLTNTLEINLINKIFQKEKNILIQESSVNYDEPLIRFVDNILQHAIHQSASDIHIEPYEHTCRIRYRQDGILHEAVEIPAPLAARLVARLKIIAKLDIAERRLPQDGRFQLQNHDIRINTCPTLFGEKIVMRILNAANVHLDINHLGFSSSQLTQFIETISQPQGMILVTGPTGSGKTITLYSALDHLNTAEKNISTVEDPVEIQLTGINQVNIHHKIGLEFSNVLRTLLRQDPDIIMVGEIRDVDTAEVAIQAAQTGHLVFSTLHTNNAIDAIIRLRSMSIASYNIASSISLIIAQRLIRKLCDFCKQPETICTDTLKIMEYSSQSAHDIFFRATGCTQCIHGYRGRTAIYELLPLSEPLTKLIITNASSLEILDQAKQEGFTTLRQAGFEKVIAGITSITEINRVLQK